MSAATAESYDLIVVGGGIYGAMTALEAARRGLRPLLLEGHDYGGATSWNSHRIVHGGLRYLQRLNIARFRTSVRERRWFLRHFPDLVQPLPSLMPLYGDGLRRPSVLRAALLANHLLSWDRNDGVRSDRVLESGGVMTAAETKSLFPAVRRDRLLGAALWYDGVMTDSQRLLMEVLRWACRRGARCLNYARADRLIVERGRVAGVVASDRVSGAPLTLRAGTVINCAGPWCDAVARDLGGDTPRLSHPSLAFNLLFRCRAPTEVAVAVAAPQPGAHTWFVYPRAGLLYAGTAHFPMRDGDDPTPSADQIESVVGQLNAAIPSLKLRRQDVARVYAGTLPVAKPGTTELSERPAVHLHASGGGPVGLLSLSGVKYTTARDVAEGALRALWGKQLPPIDPAATRPAPAVVPPLATTAAPSPDTEALDDSIDAALRDFAAAEGVVCADDLLLRRGSWADDPDLHQRLRPRVEAALGVGG